MDKGQTVAAKPIRGNIIIKIDTRQKEKYNLTDDVTITIFKGYDFNLRQDRSSMGYIISSEKIPAESEVLVNYLALEPTYEVPYLELFLTEEEIIEGYKVFSIPQDMAFCYKKDNEWNPCEGYLIVKRVFKKYEGVLEGMPNEQIKDRIYIEKGMLYDEDITSKPDKSDLIDLSGKVCICLPDCEYEIIWHNKNNREERIIRSRHREILAVDEGMTSKLKKGLLYLGLNAIDCKPLNNEKCQTQQKKKNQNQSLIQD